MAEEQSTGKNFFSTLPGIITAVAGLITAVGGFILILNKTGCIGMKTENTDQYAAPVDAVNEKDGANTGTDSSSSKKKVVYTPVEIKHLTRYLVYKIEDANIQVLPGGEKLLNLKLKCTNNSNYEYHFYANYIRAKIGEDSYPVDPYSPSGDYQSIPANGFKVLEYNIKLPATVQRFPLLFYEETKEIGSSEFTLTK